MDNRNQQGSMPPLRNKKKPWIKTSTVILGLGIFLGVVGASLLLGFGIGYVKPYMDVKGMKSGHCVVTLAESEKTLVTCACGRDAGSCHSQYPCLKILVNLTVDIEYLPNGANLQNEGDTDVDSDVGDLPMVISDSNEHVTIHNVTLYDSYETFQLQHQARKCSFHKCDRQPKNNFDGAKKFYDTYGSEIGQGFMCYFEPNTHDYAIVRVITKATVIHAMLWPSIAVIVAIIILGLSLSEKGQQATRHSSQRNAHSSPTFDLRYPGHRVGVEYEIIES